VTYIPFLTQVTLTYQTTFSNEVSTVVIPYKHAGKYKKDSGYYTCSTWQSKLDIKNAPRPLGCAPFSILRARVFITVNRLFARQNAADCVPDANPLILAGDTAQVGQPAKSIQGDSGLVDLISGTTSGLSYPPPSPPNPPPVPPPSKLFRTVVLMENCKPNGSW
jgi:hypothetical protein